MTSLRERPITPWVGRLLAANAVILLLQQTIFTSESLAQLVSFDPALAVQRPWTFVTYMFVHSGIFHLASNALALFVFGPAVERRLGGRGFIAYYFICGVGAAIFSLILHTFNLRIDPFVGASGAIIGVAYAFAWIAPDTPMMVFLIPAPIKAKWLIWLLAGYDLIGFLFLKDDIAHSAHLGGLATGLLYFTLRNFAKPVDPMPLPSMRPRVPVVARGGGIKHQPVVGTRAEPAAAQPSHEQRHGADEQTEMDRVLDKISATGIDSLTADERSFLDAAARRRRDLPH